MLDLLGLLDLQKLRHALLAKLASFAQTMLGLLDLRKLRLTRSLARTMLDLRRLRQAHSLAKLALLAQTMIRFT